MPDRCGIASWSRLAYSARWALTQATRPTIAAPPETDRGIGEDEADEEDEDAEKEEEEMNIDSKHPKNTRMNTRSWTTACMNTRSRTTACMVN